MNRVERFRGRNPGEAMRRAREALGDDARLVRARRLSGPSDPVPAYEVSVTTAPTQDMSAPNALGTDALGTIRREIEELRHLLQGRVMAEPAGVPVAAPPIVAPVAAPPIVAPVATPIAAPVAAPVAVPVAALPVAASAKAPEPRPAPMPSRELELEGEDEAWVDRLRRRGIGRARAERLVRDAAARAESNDVAGAVLRRVADELRAHSDPRPLGLRTTVFVGPSGSGKTTTLAKVAAHLLANGTRPILVSTDGESVAGEDELARVAEALGLRFETAFFSGQLAQLAQRAGAADVLLVDTPGRSPFTEEGLGGLEDVVGALDDAEIVLVIAATTDREEARATCEGYRALGVARLVFTKLDELSLPGRLVELASTVGVPIASVTHGREVRGAASSASDAGVLARVLGSAGSVEAKA